jgi:hypothetical protein
MKKPLEILIAARARRPVVLTYQFDAWLFGLVLELAEPAQRLVLEHLARNGEQNTEQLIGAMADTVTPQQMGATLSRLRKLGLMWTIRSRGVAYHDLAGWARIGGPAWRAERIADDLP